MKLLVLGRLAPALAALVRDARAAGAVVLHAAAAAEALAILRGDAAPAAVICDVTADPVSLAACLAQERITARLFACAEQLAPAAAASLRQAGISDVIMLPPAPGEVGAIMALLRGARAPIAADPAMLAVLRRAAQVARSEASVLICGESGTGKEVLARYLHQNSRRAGAAFVALNCAAIPEHLLESEMFGHERGAFSGALARRIGRFEAADGGTLLLDEISEMDLRLQAKLLRAIQEREIDRLGGAGPVRVDVRILATSNRDLRAEVAAGRFRADLFFRLDVVNLALPALRQRPGDIAPLAAHYAARFAALNGLPLRPLTADALARLHRHDWPGNVRELENIIHRAVLLAQGDAIGVEAIDLPNAAAAGPPAAIAAVMPAPMPAALSPPAMGSGIAAPGRSVAEMERALILETLVRTAGNRTHAAEMLGISLRALRNKLRDYGAHGIAVPPPGRGLAA